MFINEYPIFVKKHLLKIDMLENLRDFPRDLTDIFYQDYSDGILTGCEVTVSGNHLEIQPGVIVHHKKLYMMKEKKTIPYTNEDCTVYLKVKFLDEHRDIEKDSFLSQILLDVSESNQKDEIELCRFRLQRGSRLREDYVDFEDFNTPYDTLNRIHVPFAAKGESTIWPFLLHFFAREAMGYRLSDPLDIAFCMVVLKDQEAVDRQFIRSYLGARIRGDQEDYSNIEIYSELMKILEDIKYGKRVGSKQADQNRQIMFL